MILIAKRKLILTAEFLHRWVFKQEMSEEMRKFLGHLSWSFFGGIIAGGLLFLASILAGRWLGPEEYGKFNLVLVLSQIFFIPLAFGMDLSSARFIAKARKKEDKSMYISTSFYFLLISIFIFGSIIVLLRNVISSFVSTDSQLVLLSLFFSFILCFKLLMDGQIRGLHLFRYQTFAKVIESMVILGAFIAFIFLFQINTYVSFVASMGIGGIVIVIIYFKKILRHLRIKFDKKTFKSLVGYSRYVVVGAIISTVFIHGDKIVINKYLGTYELGIYTAYYTASVIFVTQLITMTANVFFPTISKLEDKTIVLEKVDKLLKLGIVPGFLFLSGFIFIVIKLFGDLYPLLIIVLFLFSLLGVLQFFASFYSAIVNVHSEKTYFWGLSLFAVRSVFFILYIAILIVFNMFNVTNLLMGLIINYIVDIQNLRFIIKKYATVKV